MDLTKNPFKKEEGYGLKTPDLSTKEKTSFSEEPKVEAEKSLEGTSQIKSTEKFSAEKDIPGLQKAPAARSTAASGPKSKQLKEIESILQEDLEEIYFNMDEAHKKMFKEEGERTARDIDKIVATGKSIAVKVIELVKRWLKLIPGVNKFFLEQEAKIKTDKIIKIKRDKDNV